MKLKKYLNSKNISKILVLGILASSIPINSFASILSEDGRYETFEGKNITINDVLEEEEVDVEIKGNTLVNLYKKNIPLGRGGVLTTTSESVYRLTKNDTVDSGYLQFSIDSLLLKSNTTYTLILKNYYNTKLNAEIVLYDRTEEKRISNGFVVTNFDENIILTTENININNTIQLLIYTGSEEGNFVEVSNEIILLEGNFEKEKIDYFEGMKSVGQDNENGHKIELVSQNKNLFDVNAVFNKHYANFKKDGDSLIITKTSNVSYPYIGFKIPCKKNSTYTLKYSINSYDGEINSMSGFAWVQYGSNQHIYAKRDNNYTITFTPARDYIILRFHINDGTEMDISTITFKDIQLEENNIATKYETPLLKKNEIILNEPLRGLPNGVKDKIIKRNGQWVVERNCGEKIIDGSENDWLKANTEYGLDVFRGGNLINAKIGGNIVCDKLKYIQTIVWNQGLKCSWTVGTSDIYSQNQISIGIPNIESNGSIKLIKSWLQENPLTVVYQLATPTYEPINDSKLATYLETTHISTNSIIPANLKFTVDRVANKAKECIKLAKENPTIGNISLARMWINLMRESILKDEFHDNINSVTEVSDMILERKTVSANLDLYIKCENMLSMSLDTNSITFEDFSGVEDTTKENAVNISINSSLPYNLNAYLATDIQSYDKSNSMDLDILSIKENSELDYQKFSAINNKITLKSNYESGNNKQHNIDLKLNAGVAHEKDVYKTTIKFEAEQI